MVESQHALQGEYQCIAKLRRRDLNATWQPSSIASVGRTSSIERVAAEGCRSTRRGKRSLDAT